MSNTIHIFIKLLWQNTRRVTAISNKYCVMNVISAYPFLQHFMGKWFFWEMFHRLTLRKTILCDKIVKKKFEIVKSKPIQVYKWIINGIFRRFVRAYSHNTHIEHLLQIFLVCFIFECESTILYHQTITSVTTHIKENCADEEVIRLYENIIRILSKTNHQDFSEIQKNHISKSWHGI